MGAPMLRPNLFIGVGGAGGKTLRSIFHSLSIQLESAGYTDGIPDAWQFLHIDTTLDGLDFPLPLLEPHQFYSPVPAGMDYKGLVDQALSLGGEVVKGDFLSGWATPPRPILINTSRSMHRSIGRIASLGNLAGMKAAIEKAINQMSSPQAQTDLYSVGKHFPTQSLELQPEVYIFSSMVGGSGSGIFLDVAEILKSINLHTASSGSHILLYTPEAFDSIPVRNGFMAPNTLGVLNEITTERFGVTTSNTWLAYSLSGMPNHSDGSRGNQYHFLGKNNSLEEVDGNQNHAKNLNDILLETGESFAGAILNGSIYNWLDRFSVWQRPSFSRDISWQWPDVNIQSSIWGSSNTTNLIIEHIAETKNYIETWTHFWEGYRSKTLIESIPMPNEVRKSIITGWFISALFGLRKLEDSRNGPLVRIWNPTLPTPDWSNFPFPLPPIKPEDEEKRWLLPSVLKSSSIALCNFGVTGDSKELQVFKFLLFAGREVTTRIPSRDRWDVSDVGDHLPNGEVSKSTILKNWLDSGSLPSNRERPKFFIGQNDETPKSRADMLKNRVKETQASFNRSWAELANESWFTRPETWELREDIENALTDIQEFLTSNSWQS
jgi:hypothetical protein